jgi:hypothetical protein
VLENNMNSINKKCNVIVYKPGLAGHFLSFTLSLNDDTYPLLLKNAEGKDRLDNYTFKNLRWKYGNWMHFHGAFQKPDEIFCDFLSTEYSFCTVELHPWEFDSFKSTCEKHKFPLENCNLISIHLSSKRYHIIDDFKKMNGNVPKPYPTEERDWQNFLISHKSYYVSLDNIFSGRQSFIEEYIKLCDFTKQEPNLEKALVLYKDWFHERKLYKYFTYE